LIMNCIHNASIKRHLQTFTSIVFFLVVEFHHTKPKIFWTLIHVLGLNETSSFQPIYIACSNNNTPTTTKGVPICQVISLDFEWIQSYVSFMSQWHFMEIQRKHHFKKNYNPSQFQQWNIFRLMIIIISWEKECN